MAAYAALVSLMNVMHDIQNHHSPPISLDTQQAQSLLEKVNLLLEFLEGYTSPLADTDEADPLEIRIADAAYAAEDVIEFHIVNVIKLAISTTTAPRPETAGSSGEETQSSSSEETDDSDEEYESGTGEEDESGTGEEDDDDSGEETASSSGEETASSSSDSEIINEEEEEICDGEVSCIKLYEDLHEVIQELDLLKEELMTKVGEGKLVVHHLQQRNVSTSLSPTVESSTTMVTSEEVLLEIKDQLVAGSPRRQVIPVIGMGGIGKTTLAINIYADLLIKDHFDIRAWATISQLYNTREILCELLSRKAEPGESDDKLGLELYQSLFNRRFLIVMDDMWGIDAWDKVQRFFPNNENGSRILVTTRLSHLSSQLNGSYSLRMKFLDELNSWDLFSKTVFGEETCPPELKEIGKEIVENCRGLPLSIVVVGGLLKKMEHTQECWESMMNNLTSSVNLENDRHCLRLLKISYNHLPVYLKPLFLYMGVYEEDIRIRVSNLIKLWVSEGFLKPVIGKSLKAIARGFFKDLVDRNLILVFKLGSTRKIKYCNIHDLMRDMCLRETEKCGFYHVIGESNPQGINNSQRRVVIRDDTSKKNVRDALRSMSHTRSVICEDGIRMCRNLRLLRMLDWCDVRSNGKYINALMFGCLNLRHIVIQIRRMSSFLSSINLIWNLQTLSLDCTFPCDEPLGIWEMPQLRHIEFTAQYPPLQDPPPVGEEDEAVVMENLEILSGIKDFKCSEDVVKRIPNVKKLGISYENDGDDYSISNIKSLDKLESLDIRCFDKLRGVVASLHELHYPHSLKSLSLRMHSETEWGEMLDKIGSLPHLEKLKLCHGCFGRGNKWEMVEGQFPSLKSLKLCWCRGLKEWTIEESDILPRLERLQLYELKKLKEIPSEIGSIATLRRIKLVKCSISAVKSAKEIVEEQEEYEGEEQLSFRVKVAVSTKNKALRKLASLNFEVEVRDY